MTKRTPKRSTTTKTITDAQIRTLRVEARAAHDSVQVHVCSVALEEEQPVTDGIAWEERYGGGGFLRHEQLAIMAVKTSEQARAMCAKAIGNASAQS